MRMRSWRAVAILPTCLLLLAVVAGGCSETPARTGDNGLVTDSNRLACGNGVREGAELCDGSDLGGRICTGEGFDGGPLACKTNCTLDTSGCFRCGDGRIGGAEACDGAALDGKTCKAQGFDTGELGCTAGCQLDLSKCTIASCGNRKRDPAEPCEGDDLGGKTCKSEGFEGGTLSCNANCSLKLSACFKCGDNVINGTEQCDGGQLGGKTCKSLGFSSGTLGCKSDCTFSTTACQSSPAPDARPASDKSKIDLSIGKSDGVNWGTGPLPEGNSGIAVQHQGDNGIAAHPSVVFVDDFESYASASNLTSKWDNVFQNGHLTIVTATANVYRGAKALQFDVPQQSAEMSNAVAKKLTKEQDILFLRYYSKFDAKFNVLGSSHNGATISAHYFINGWQATPGIPANGNNKFLAAYEHWRDTASTPNPGNINTYIYHPEQRDVWGDHFFPTGVVLPNTSLPFDFGPSFVKRPDLVPNLGQWYAYEFMVKANTPGKRDGRIACWLDGKLVADFPNLRLRDVATLTIDEFDLSLHVKTNTIAAARKWVDNVVVATSYIGPLVDP